MIFETVRAILAEQLGFEESEIARGTSIADDLQVQQTDMQELMLLLEQEYEIEWTEDDLGSLETVGDIVSFIENQAL